MKIVVLGATGNVGTSVLAALADLPGSHEVVAVARREPGRLPGGARFVATDIARDDLVPVLRAADVSFAMGGGSALAQVNADCVLASDRLQALADCARGAARTLAVIRQNLAWATLYNAVAIPAAALGWINPWVSALGMSASSALVVANALRLMRVRKPSAS